ncbi:MAG: FkbM family methyltransferase [Pseudomonadales bacterium]
MIKKIVKNMAGVLGIELVRSQRLDQLLGVEIGVAELLHDLIKSSGVEGQSKAQLHQDIIVLLATNFKRNGFFVEFGATNGIDLSNTYLLEKSYGWKGILAEPAKVWHDDLRKNRSVDIDFSCVWKVSNDVVNFNMVDCAELSTISEFSDRDQHSKARTNGVTYEVETISLNDLLEKYDSPTHIDYLSIDTEGSEFEILNGFDFNKYDISIISCEHNYTKDRERIFKLLSDNGYDRKFTGLSKWDDWYFKA